MDGRMPRLSHNDLQQLPDRTLATTTVPRELRSQPHLLACSRHPFPKPHVSAFLCVLERCMKNAELVRFLFTSEHLKIEGDAVCWKSKATETKNCNFRGSNSTDGPGDIGLRGLDNPRLQAVIFKFPPSDNDKEIPLSATVGIIPNWLHSPDECLVRFAGERVFPVAKTGGPKSGSCNRTRGVGIQEPPPQSEQYERVVREATGSSLKRHNGPSAN
nr:hypothetical protein Iba_chr15aCG9940 [Ipomoea batatas]